MCRGLKNLISISSLCKMNYSISFNDTTIVLRKNKMFICIGALFNNLYYIIASFMETNRVENILTYEQKQLTTNQTYL